MNNDDDDSMSVAKFWRGIYRDIAYEIVQHSVNLKVLPNGVWCFYLFIPYDCAPLDEWDRPGFDSDESVLSDIEWHVGMTFYQQRTINGVKHYKVGCDYAHACDDGIKYNEFALQKEAKKAIDSFFNGIAIDNPK